MDSGYIIFWVVFSIVLGVLYYRFTAAGNASTQAWKTLLGRIWQAQKAFIPHRKFILGIVLVAVAQYNFTTTETPPYSYSELVFAIMPAIDLSKLGIPDPPLTLANYLLLLGGCFILVSALKDFGSLPPEKDTVPPAGTLFPSNRMFFLTASAIGLGLNFYLLWQLHHQSTAASLVGIWLVTILLFGYMLFRWDWQEGIFNGPGIRRSDLIWLSGLSLFGLLVGMYRLQGLPDQLIPDEGSFWEMASSIASGAHVPLFFDHGVYTFPILSSFAQAAILKLFGISFWSWRFSSLLAGLLTIFPLYLLARELFDRRVAVVSCVIMVTCEYFLAFSRLGYNNSQALFPVTLALYFIALGIRRNSMLYFYLAGCAAGLGFYTYTASRSALVIAALLFATLWLQNRKAPLKIFKAAIMLGLGWYILTSPLFALGMVRNPETMTEKLKESIFFHTVYAVVIYPREQLISDPGTLLSADGVYFFNPGIYTVLLARGIVRSLLSFNIAAGLVREHFITAPLAGTVGAAFFTIGMLVSLMHFRERRHHILLYWFAVNIILLSTLTTFPPRHQHLVSVIPLIAIWAALGVVSVANGFSHLYLDRPRFRAILVFILTAVTALSGLYSYFIAMSAAYPPSREQVMAWTGLYAGNEKIIFVYDEAGEAIEKPFVINKIRKDVSFVNIPLQELPAQLNGKTVVFFPPEAAGRIQPVLRSAWPEIITLRTFYDYRDVAVVQGAANFAVDFGPARGLDATVRDSYSRPGSWLILLAAISLVFAGRFRASWLEHAPGWLRTTYTWLTTER